MKIVADLHLHSKYSRAVSRDMVLVEMEKWANKKGIDVLATGDWTHPLWVREIQNELVEKSDGLFGLKNNSSDILFLLSTEISSIYQQGGKLRRVHNLVFAPSFETVSKINAELIKRGCNLSSDGRPIIGLSCRELAELIFSIDKNCLIVPAHCLPPGQLLHVKEGLKKIEDIKESDLVFTHKGKLEKVTKVMVRNYDGKVYNVRPFYFRMGLKTTEEHPFYAIKTKKRCSSTGGFCKQDCSEVKNCKNKAFLNYKPQWVMAKDLENSDVLLYPRFKLTEDVKEKSIAGKKIIIDNNFCRLVGYYLAEGSTDNGESINFCFSGEEERYVKDVRNLMNEIFAIDHCREYKRKGSNGVELSFYSKKLSLDFGRLFYSSDIQRKANTKCLPNWMLYLPKVKQKEIFIGWWRGDVGYTSSRLLANQMKIILLRLGIIPSILVDTAESHRRRGNHGFRERIIKANYDSYNFSNLSFFKDEYELLKLEEFMMFKTKMKRRHGWMDENYVYIPVRDIEIEDYKGPVYNLEVKGDNSYVAEFATVHNCWTPWFALYGSMSGFDSIEEAFGNFSKNIYGVETGLSSDPLMNWRVKELDNRSILSFSDAHSGAKLGREATIFAIAKTSFSDIRNAIITGSINSTIEFYPEEGKYHYSGHRKCKIRQKNGGTCPVCGKPLTAGVMQRVEKLAGRSVEEAIKYGSLKRPGFVKLVSLSKIIAESIGVGEASNKVIDVYDNLIRAFGNELFVLMEAGISEIAKISGEKISEGILKVRKGDIVIDPGYDGEYGVVKIWGTKSEETLTSGQMRLI